jgi:long-chain fatty acid transport protein
MNRWILVATALAVATPSAAHAGGLFLPGMGPQGQARAGAFVAKADDPSTMAHNPAGFAKLDHTVAFVGINLVKMSLKFDRAGTYEPTGDGLPYEGEEYPAVENDASPSPGIAGFQAIPTIVVSTDLGRPELPFRFAIGFYAPQAFAAREFADTVTLANGVEAPAPQRYDAAIQKGQAAYPSIAASYSPLDNLHVGARFSSGFSFIEVTKIVWAIRNYDEYNEKDSTTVIEASDLFVPTYGAGVLWAPTRHIEIGAAWNSAANVHAVGDLSSTTGSAVPEGNELRPNDGTPVCADGSVVGAIKTCVDFTLPQTASVGARWVFRDGAGLEAGDVELDVKWEDWSAGSITQNTSDALHPNGQLLEPSRIEHGFQDVISVRLGGSYVIPLGSNSLTLRAGVAHDTKTAPVSWTRVDQDSKPRTMFATGIAYQGDAWRVDVGGGIIVEPDRTVSHDCQEPAGPSQTSPGCDGDGDTPLPEREAPDPAQPLAGTNGLLESPFNAGTYESGYVLMHLGFSAWF